MKNIIQEMLSSAKGKKNHKTHGKYRALIRIDIEADVPRQMKKLYKINCADRSTHESVKPLYNYLLSKVGKKWDDTYSELKRDLSPYENHILKYHLGWMLCNVALINNVPFYKGYELISRNGSYLSFYVDNDNILRTARIEKRHSVNHDDKDEIKITDKYRFNRYNGIWYVCLYEEVMTDYLHMPKRKYLRLASKQQLNTKEIKQLKLNEGNIPSIDILKKLGFVNNKKAA